MEAKGIIIMSIAIYLSFGYYGFMAWVFEAYLKKIKIPFKEWVKIFFVMLLGGVFSWLISWRSITNYIK